MARGLRTATFMVTGERECSAQALRTSMRLLSRVLLAALLLGASATATLTLSQVPAQAGCGGEC